MPLWAHYANNHKGFCVSYNIKCKENLELSSFIFPIQYTRQRIDITSQMIEQARQLIKKAENHSSLDGKVIKIDDLSLLYIPLFLSNIKHTSWSYEKEYRCTTASSASGMPFLPAKPSAIYIGMKCSDKDTSRLIDISNELRVPVYKMSFNECASCFDLTASPLTTEHHI